MTFEVSEAFTVKLSVATNLTITMDPAPRTTLFPYTTLFRSIDDVSQAEGSTGGTTAFTFTVTKTGATTQSVTVGFTTVDGRSEERRVGKAASSGWSD